MKNELKTIEHQEVQANARGVVLTSMRDMYAFSEHVVRSGLAPKGLNNASAVMIALQAGAEIGMSPNAALQSIAVINNRPSLWGDGMLAVCRSSGKFDESVFHEVVDGVGDDMVAQCTVRRIGAEHHCVREFSARDAKQASLWGKSGPWSQYPKRMLQMRARSFALRDAFTDVLCGMASADEMIDVVASQPASKPLIERLKDASPMDADMIEAGCAPDGPGPVVPDPNETVGPPSETVVKQWTPRHPMGEDKLEGGD